MAHDPEFPRPRAFDGGDWTLSAPGAYRRLNPDRIVETLARLHRRVQERFPASGLSHVAAEAVAVAKATDHAAQRLRRPFLGLRLAVAGIILAGLAAQAATARYVRLDVSAMDALGLFQGLDAAVNLLILAAGGVWFLLTLEERIKRGRALARLHDLRSLAHVVDMHQLTKDPTMLLAGKGTGTASSPQRPMSEFQLTRYLEYCSELLALIGKLAALYAETSRDAVVIEAVNDVERLCAELGRKIWQKITIIKQLDERRVKGASA